jgi:molecular chaperone GrpE
MAESEEKQQASEGVQSEHGEESPTIDAELEEVNRERTQFRDMALRSQADLENYKRRMEKERTELHRAAVGGVLLKLLPILDNLQRALEYTSTNAQEETWLEGIRLIERSFEALLASEGVVVIEAEGNPFNPSEHEAVFSVASAEHQLGTVVNVTQKGYKHRDKVLRPAQVAVAKTNDQESQAADKGQAEG